MQHSSFFKKASLLVAMATTITTTSFAALASNQGAIDAFEAKTKPIAQDAKVLSDKQLVLMDDFNQLMESGNAAAVFQSGKVAELQALGEQTLVQAKLFVKEYEQFLAQLPKTSTCYTPENVTEYNQLINEVATKNQSLSELSSTVAPGDEMAATMAVLNLQMHAGQVSGLVQMFQLVKMCYITEAMGYTKQDVERMQAEEEQ
ncbi:hypothetical protein GCM10009347_39020 [Shewanella algicola]|uniref:Uncharacterized protein n=1 Tax=Shewanella algicola TaxID=640633 RepID=A0A9X1Z856_9GAMM|nr:hypothetical protein [Shewanella algicola]MCL1107538.1 hypothetical protein [Shewanella algicola]GGP70091.1 hypothetical protein GCM10009347_39020 [Shewanella algicola]